MKTKKTKETKKTEENEPEDETWQAPKGATSLQIKGDAEVRAMVSLYYDLQGGRINYEGRIRSLKQEVSAETDTEYPKLKQALKTLDSLEKNLKATFITYCKEHKQYEWLKRTWGIGPTLAANLIAIYGDCSNFDNISKMWSYSGLSVEDGKAVRKKRGEKIHYNPFAKTLAWKIATQFEKGSPKKSYYRRLYDRWKANYQARPDLVMEAKASAEKGKGEKGHIRNMTVRKVAKRFLANYWLATRKMYGLEVTKPFVIDSLKHIHFEEHEFDRAAEI